jgi:6-phosphogluconate dehydrogenase (decarboxylating)
VANILLLGVGAPTRMRGATLPSNRTVDPNTLWRFVHGRDDAWCVLAPHPSGHELRYVFNGVELMGVVSENLDDLKQRALEWRVRLVAEGWTEIDPHADATAVRLAKRSGK